VSESEATPRMNAATMEQHRHLEAMAHAARASEASVTVECDDTAKGDTTPTIKIYAPLGCDTDALAKHAAKVASLAVKTHKDVQQKFPRVT
jgi:hypothetical protein